MRSMWTVRDMELSDDERRILRLKIESRSMPAPPSTCRLWLGATNLKGYGNMSAGNGKASRLVHRIIFYLEHGWWPPLVRHSCDTPCCVEPTHLLPGTPRDNTLDMFRRGRSHTARGERASNTKLTEQQVREIRASSESYLVLAARYGVKPRHIYCIWNRESWRHLE